MGETKQKVIPAKTITMQEARTIAREEFGITVSIQTIHKWVDKKKLGFQPSGNCGHWRVFEDKFREHISGNKERNTEA
jgi:hypothetical protein